MSDRPSLMAMTQQQFAELENCMKQPVEVRQMPRLPLAAIRPSDVRLTLTFCDPVLDSMGQPVLDEDGLESYTKREERYFIREMIFEDATDIAAVGPAILETFFQGNEDLMGMTNFYQLAQQVIAKSLAMRIRMCLTDLGDAILEKTCSFIVHTKTKEFLTIEQLMSLDPTEGADAIKSALDVNSVFFSHLGSRVPANIKDGLRSLTGMLSAVGNPVASMLARQD